MGGEMSKCENCGRFVTRKQLWHSKELGHSVCDHCHDPDRDGNMGVDWLTDYDDDVASLLVDGDPFQFR